MKNVDKISAVPFRSYKGKDDPEGIQQHLDHADREIVDNHSALAIILKAH